MNYAAVTYAKQRLLVMYKQPLLWLILLVASGYSVFSITAFASNDPTRPQYEELFYYLFSNWSILTYGYLFLFVLTTIFFSQHARFTIYVELRLTRINVFFAKIMLVLTHAGIFIIVTVVPSLVAIYAVTDTVNIGSIQRMTELITILYMYIFLCIINIVTIALGGMAKSKLIAIIGVLAYIFVYPTLMQIQTGLNLLPITPQANILLIHRGDDALYVSYLSSLLIIAGLVILSVSILYYKERYGHASSIIE